MVIGGLAKANPSVEAATFLIDAAIKANKHRINDVVNQMEKTKIKDMKKLKESNN